jgi:cyclohexyl-isocyanide hydratase
MATPRRIGMLIFPRLTQLDMTGPYEVLARLPDTKVDLVARTLAPVTTDRGMQIVPTVPMPNVRRSMSSWCRAAPASRT